MSTEQISEEPSKEEIETFKRQTALAVKAAKEALNRANIPEGFPSRLSRDKLSLEFLYQETGDNVILSVELVPSPPRRLFIVPWANP
ncbi:MAG: hypothetical protein IPK98_06085 [Chloracidobacterium sp.]|nr:hypothetical protein [Chloracidobacterium sp.]